jgi:hypothetical protein
VRYQLVTTVSLFLAFGAAAQTITSGGVGGRAWSGPIAEAFFTDDSMLILRPHAEIMDNWRGLSEMERQRVRRDCEKVGATPRAAEPAPADTGAGAAPEPSPRPDAGAAPGAAAPAGEAAPDAGSPSERTEADPDRGGGAAVSIAGSRSIGEICSIVRSM